MRHRRRASSVTIAFVLSTLAAMGSVHPAQAAVADQLLNGGFETTYTQGTNVSANEWQEKDAPSNDAVAGSIYVNNAAADTGSYSVVLYPSSTYAVRLEQRIPTGPLAGHNPTLKGSWRVQSGGVLGLKITLRYLTSTTAGGDTTGVENTSNCVYTDSTGGTSWEDFTVTSMCTSSLPSSHLWDPLLVIETTGTPGTGEVIRVDSLALEVEETESFTSSWTNLSASDFNTLDDDNDLTMISDRHGETSGVDPDFSPHEVYGMNIDGSEATRLTTTGHVYLHTAVNPVDRTQVAAVRFVCDCGQGEDDWNDYNDDGGMTETRDPYQLMLLDLANDRERPLIPAYKVSGLGGIEWTPDGKWLVTGVDTGRYWEIMKVKPDGTALTDVVNDSDRCYESDVGVSNSGDWIAYRRTLRNSDGTCVNEGLLMLVNLTGNGSPVELYNPSGSGGIEQGLPVGIYDAEWSPDDSKILFSLNTSNGFDTVSLPVTGGTPTTILNDAPFNPGEDSNFRLVPDWHWSPGVSDIVEGLVTELEWDGDAEAYTYFGLGTYDPYDGSDYDPVESHERIEDGGVWLNYITGGRHDPTANWPSTGAFDTNPDEAYEADNVYAVANDALGEKHQFYNFNLDDSIPASAEIDGISVRLDWKADSATGWPHFNVELSWNGGTSWTDPKTSAVGSGSEERHGVPESGTDQWQVGGQDRDWSVSEFTNSNFRVRLECDCHLENCSSRDWSLDHVAVRVYWH